jgi:3-polyprenyl-4-hydroxybenzoate decarboxylase
MQVFISYARADGLPYAKRLVEDLSEYDLDLWLDIHSIPKGANWDYEVQKGLDSSDVMLVLLTPSAVNSQNVADEWSYFIEKDKPVVPLMMVPCEVPFRLSRRQRIDFTVDHEQGLRELLRAIGSPPKLDPEATARLKIPPAERPVVRSGGAPSGPTAAQLPRRPAPASPTSPPDVTARVLPVIWGKRYHWLNGMRPATVGQAVINHRELALVPANAPMLIIPLRNVSNIRQVGGLDPHIKIDFYSAQGNFDSLVLMGAPRARRKQINHEIINMLSLLKGRALE